jgi:hypothetical protein
MRPESRAARVASNESVFREANEQLADVFQRQVQGDHRVPFLCECSDRSCTRVIEISLEEYADARRHPARFLTLAGHEDPESEVVVSGGARYHIVEKRGEAATVASRLAPGNRAA